MPTRRRGWIALGLFLAVWIGSWLVLLGRAPLPGAPDARRFLFGELATSVLVLIALWLARRRPGPAPDSLGIRQPARELWIGLGYLALVLLGARALGLSTHVASVGLTHDTLAVWHRQTPGSIWLWAGYFFGTCVVVPLAAARWRGYGAGAMLLGFPRGLRWPIYCAVAGAVTLSGFAGPEYFRLPLSAHLLAIVVFLLGTFLPVMVLIQGLIVPRLALVSGSWITGAVLGGLVYGGYHAGEFFMTWRPETLVLSVAWFSQFAFFGLLKALTTLGTGSAWIHIFNTHLPHLAEAPALAEVFGIEG